MRTLIDVNILKIYVGEATYRQGRPLYEVIVHEARQRGMAGASVHRGFMGFGASNLLHTAKILRLSEDLPVTVEIVDTPARIAAFLPVVDELLEEGSLVVSTGQAVFHLPLRIRDVMTDNVATVHVRTPLNDVVALLLRREIKAVPVMDGRTIAGIITGGDLLARARMPLRLDMHGHMPPELRGQHDHGLEFQGLEAQDVMTCPVQTLNIRTTVDDALNIMARRHIKRLPVTADDGSLMGIVSRTDVLAAIGRTSAVAAHLDILPQGVHATARDILYTSVSTVGPDEPLSDILDKIVASPLRLVVVVDPEQTILGIVHDWNLLETMARKHSPGLVARLLHTLTQRGPVGDPLEGTARDVMQPAPLTAGPEATLAEIIPVLVEHRMKRLVIADSRNRLLGIVDRDVILQGLACMKSGQATDQREIRPLVSEAETATPRETS